MTVSRSLTRRSHPSTRRPTSSGTSSPHRPGRAARVLSVALGLWVVVVTTVTPATWAGWSQATPEPSGGTAPEAVDCGVPLETQEPVASPEASPLASPVASGTPEDRPGTPSAASPVASPAAGERDEDRAARIGRDIERVSLSLVRCLSDEEYATAARLATPEYRGTLAGTGETLDVETFVAIMESLTTTAVEVRAIADTVVEDDGRASAEVITVVADQLFRARWTFDLIGPDSDRDRLDASQPEPNRRWVVSGAEPLAVDAPAGADEVEVALTEYEIAVDPESVDGPDVVLEIANDGAFAHEVVVLRVDDGASVDALLYQSGPSLPDGLTFAGQTPVESDGEATLVLIGLTPGDYALVDLSPDPTGALNLALGMRATLTIAD